MDRVDYQLHLFTGSDLPKIRGELAYLTPKQRQFVITISGAVEITCAGGSRVFGPGDVLFAEDLKGEGHSNRELHGPRMSLIIQVTEDFDIRRFTTDPRANA